MNQEKIEKLKAAATDCHGWSWPDRNKVDGTHQFGKRDEDGNFNEVGTIDVSTYTDDYADDIKVLKFLRAAQPAAILELIALAEHSISAQDEVLTDAAIIDKIDRPGFAWENLDAAEQRNLLGSIRELLAAAAPSPAVAVEPVAYGAFYTGGRRAGKLYAHCDTKEQIDAYIADVHQRNDTITLRSGPLYLAATPPSLAVRDVVEVRPQDVIDAARYRWLRDKARSVDWAWNLDANSYRTACRNNAAQMDLSIDTAMKD